VGNVIADALSHLLQFDDYNTEMELISPVVTIDNNIETFSIELDKNAVLESL
jgi:hypothetical protein